MEKEDKEDGISISSAFSEEGRRFILVSFLLDDIVNIRSFKSTLESDIIQEQDTVTALKEVIAYYTTKEEYERLRVAEL